MNIQQINDLAATSSSSSPSASSSLSSANSQSSLQQSNLQIQINGNLNNSTNSSGFYIVQTQQQSNNMIQIKQQPLSAQQPMQQQQQQQQQFHQIQQQSQSIQQYQQQQPTYQFISSNQLSNNNGQFLNSNSIKYSTNIQQPTQQSQQQLIGTASTQAPRFIIQSATSSPVSNQNNQNYTQLQQLSSQPQQQQQQQQYQAHFNNQTQTTYLLQQQQQPLNINSTNNNNNSQLTANNTNVNSLASGVATSGGQLFININNRIVPIQSLNIKPVIATATSNANSQVTPQNLSQQQQPQRLQILNPNANNYVNGVQYNQHQQSAQPQQQQQQQIVYSNNIEQSQQPSASTQQQYLILSNTNTSTTNQQNLINPVSLGGEIADKMKLLEQIQNQLKAFQVKLQQSSTDPSQPQQQQQNTFTQQQIQSILTSDEQTQLQKLIIQRKSVTTEIQQLQQKLLLGSSSSSSTNSNASNSSSSNGAQLNNNGTIISNSSNASNNMEKIQLLQQVTAKLSNMKATRTNEQQQLVLTQDEYNEMKKLLELQSQLQNELQALNIPTITTTSSTSSTTTATSTSTSTTGAATTTTIPIKLNELGIADKIKLNEIIKAQIQQLTITINNGNTQQQLQQLQPQDKEKLVQAKEKYIVLMKKQAELQALIQQDQSNNKSTGGQILVSTSAKTINDAIKLSTEQQPTYQIIANNSNGRTNNQTVTLINNIPSNTSTMSPQLTITGSNNQQVINNTNVKQTPIKIRNVLSATNNNTNIQQTDMAGSLNEQISKQQSTTPLRTLIINNNNLNQKSNVALINGASTSTSTSTKSTTATTTTTTTPSPSSTQQLVPLETAINLHKQNFPHVSFKCLNFEELAQHSIITAKTDDITINMLKQLDDRAATVINKDQLESFAKNQIKLVNKYLEQQKLFKMQIKNRIQEQLQKDQRLVVEPDYKTPFSDKTDAIKRLSRYHVLQKTLFEPSEQESKKFDECFEEVSARLIKTADAMKKRFHLFQLRSMQKEVVPSEETLLLRLFVEDLKQSFETEKQTYKEQQEKQLQQQQQLHLQQQQIFKQELSSPNTTTTVIPKQQQYLTIKYTPGINESPTTIRKLIQNSSIQNIEQIQQQQQVQNSLTSNALKRSLKADDTSPSHRNVKQSHLIETNNLVNSPSTTANQAIKNLILSSNSTISNSNINLKSESSTSLASLQSQQFIETQMLATTTTTPPPSATTASSSSTSLSFDNKNNTNILNMVENKPLLNLVNKANTTNYQSNEEDNEEDDEDDEDEEDEDNEDDEDEFVNYQKSGNAAFKMSSFINDTPTSNSNSMLNTNPVNTFMNNDINQSAACSNMLDDNNTLLHNSASMNNLSGLDDLILNEDELAVESILDF